MMYTMMKSFVLDQMYLITCSLKHVRQMIRSSDRFMSASKQVAIHRTCPEERATSNSSLPSGMYWIDPDGQGVGDDPINVFCDMTSGQGFTSVRRGAEKHTEVGNCDDPGCYSRNITYDATMK